MNLRWGEEWDSGTEVNKYWPNLMKDINMDAGKDLDKT